MKKHRRGKAKGLKKQEKRYLNAMIWREVIMLLIVMTVGAVVVAIILAMTKEVSNL